jgi:hypothetical protein
LNDATPARRGGLCGIAFGNAIQNQPIDTLFFAAGPTDESHGAFGRIDDALPGSPGDDNGND